MVGCNSLVSALPRMLSCALCTLLYIRKFLKYVKYHKGPDKPED